MIILNKNNSGHGPSCIYGYRYAIEKNYPWIFQIDSDGQCDPTFFEIFWKNKELHPWQWGNRRTRDDGWQRIVVTKILSFVVWLGSGIYVKDANVPYRLMPSTSLAKVLNLIPENFFLANVLLSVLIQAHEKILWHTIHFRNRLSGVSKVRGWKFAKIGYKLFMDLLKMREHF